MSDVSDFLEHYGVKGMKWGKRNSKNKRKAAKSQISNDAKRAEYAKTKMKKGGVKALSNNEIRDLQKRLDLEKRLQSVTPRRSDKAAIAFIAGMGATVAKGAVTSMATQQVNNMIKDLTTNKAPKDKTPKKDKRKPNVPGYL